MGYESRIFFAERRAGSDFASGIVAIDLSCMGYHSGFHELFKNECDFYVSEMVSNANLSEAINEHFDDVQIDYYGKRLTYAPLKDVLEWCEREAGENAQDDEMKDYRRFKLLYAMCKQFDTAQWENIIVIHFGF